MQIPIRAPLTVVLAALACVSACGLAAAQSPDKGRQPGAGHASPSPRAATPSPAPRASPAPVQRAPSVQRSTPQGSSAAQRNTQPRAAERSTRMRERAVERNSTQKRATQQAQERRQQQLKERRAQPGPQQPAAKQPPKQVEKGPARPDVAGKRAQPGAQPVARVQATDQQRRQVRERLFRSRQVQRIPRKQLNVPLTVGSHIPRHHRLHRFTPALLALAPMYAAYSYLVVDDEICVVDPESYAVVDVIPSSIEQAGRGPGSSGGRLTLSAAQMRCVYESVPKDEARVDLRISLALGAEIPRDVKLAKFPERALGCAPGLANFGYIVVQDDVVIVDPADYAIVQVISA